MSYQVIARKYRPQRFSEVVGQEHVTQTLGNAIEQNRIAHAYLFVGPRGTGKTTIARIFAKCLNCTGGPSKDFPDSDPKCIEITEGRSLDVLEIDGASNRGIEEIRELRDTVKYAPASSKYKIYIIDEVHMLTKEAFNALLKTLEEPPEHVKFMFATTEPEKVLPTILSRCQRFDLRRIPASLIVKHLSEIAARENVQIDEPALYAIARGAEGGMRDAESTLDQLISFCGNKIQEADVLSMFGLAARAQLLALARAILDGAPEVALKELNDLARNGKDLSRLIGDLLSYFRNLMIFQVSKGDLSLMDVSEAEAAELAKAAGDIPSDAVTRIMEVLSDAESRLRDAASKKIFLEIMLLKAIEARNAQSIDSVLKQLNSLRNGSDTAPRAQQPSTAPSPRPVNNEPVRPQSAAPASYSQSERSQATIAVQETPAPAPKTAPQPEPPSNLTSTALAEPPAAPQLATSSRSSSLDADIEQLWTQLLDAVGRASPFVKTYLLESHPVTLNKTAFTIGFDPEFKDHLSLVDNPRNRAILETKLRELGFQDVGVRFIQAPAPADRARRAPEPPAPEIAAPLPTHESARPRATSPAVTTTTQAPPTPAAHLTNVSKEDFKNDPLIRKALEIFKGTIVEIRA